MKEIIPHIKDIVFIVVLIVLSLILGGLFLKVEELKQRIPEDTHTLLDNSIRESVRSAVADEFRIQEWKGNVFTDF